MCVNKIKRFELVSLAVTQANQQFQFQDIPNLRNQDGQKIVIKDIEIFTPAVIALDPSGSGLAVSPLTELQKAVLVLYVNGEQSIYKIPLLKLNRNNDGTAAAFQMEPQAFDDLQNVDWNKSYVQLTSVAVPSYAFVLGINYLKLTTSVQS